MKKEIELDIAGQRLKVRTDEDEAYMHRLAAYVDEQMRDIGRGQRGIASINIALLTALRIADEYHKLNRLQVDVDSALEHLAEQVEATLDKQQR